MKEQFELFDPMNREWRIRCCRDTDDFQVRKLQIATIDEDFTRDSKTEIEYYCDHIALDPHANSDDYVHNSIEFVRSLIDNDGEFRQPELWRVRQTDMTEDSIVRRFVGVPLPFFWRLWRRPLIPRNIRFEPIFDGSAMLRFSYHEGNDPLMSMDFTLYLDWLGLFDDIKRHKCYQLQTIMPWIHRHCEGRLYLFSDFDSIFENVEDEVRYLADIGTCK